MAKRRVKVVLTGFYEVDMDHALEDYATDDPEKMLALDQANADMHDPFIVVDWLDEDPTVTLSWEE
jgi:hypothetical protein